MTTDSLWISVFVKRQGSVLKENLIICVKNDMLFWTSWQKCTQQMKKILT